MKVIAGDMRCNYDCTAVMHTHERFKSKARPPDRSGQIETFRKSLNLTQSGFGKRLGVSAMSVSRWERGILKVPANIYIKLGNLAGDPLCWYFWGCAGLQSGDVMRVLPAARDRLHENWLAEVMLVHAGGIKNPPLKQPDFVAIPLLPIHAGTPGENGDREVDLEQIRPETLLVAPRDWCPNPNSTICLRARVNSMSPLILDGYIIAVDTSKVSGEAIVGKIALAWNAEKGLLVSRLIRFDKVDVLVPDHREYESVSLAPEAAWRIIGVVLWWTGKAR